MSAHNLIHEMYEAPLMKDDPGDAGTIYVDRWGQITSLTSGADAETRTKAQPLRAGILSSVVLDTDGGGAVTLTVTGGYNADDDTAIVLADAGDFVTFISIRVGSSYYWRLVAQDGTDAAVEDVTVDVLTVRDRLIYQVAAPETATATASLTDAQMLAGILVATPTAAAAYTVRTGTQLEAALVAAGYSLAVNDAFDLTIINLGGTGDDITFTAATGITVVGDTVIRPIADTATEQAGQGTYRIRRTAENVFVAYRIA